MVYNLATLGNQLDESQYPFRVDDCIEEANISTIDYSPTRIRKVYIYFENRINRWLPSAMGRETSRAVMSIFLPLDDASAPVPALTRPHDPANKPDASDDEDDGDYSSSKLWKGFG